MKTKLQSILESLKKFDNDFLALTTFEDAQLKKAHQEKNTIKAEQKNIEALDHVFYSSGAWKNKDSEAYKKHQERNNIYGNNLKALSNIDRIINFYTNQKKTKKEVFLYNFIDFLMTYCDSQRDITRITNITREYNEETKKYNYSYRVCFDSNYGYFKLYNSGDTVEVQTHHLTNLNYLTYEIDFLKAQEYILKMNQEEHEKSKDAFYYYNYYRQEKESSLQEIKYNELKKLVARVRKIEEKHAKELEELNKKQAEELKKVKIVNI